MQALSFNLSNYHRDLKENLGKSVKEAKKLAKSNENQLIKQLKTPNCVKNEVDKSVFNYLNHSFQKQQEIEVYLTERVVQAAWQIEAFNCEPEEKTFDCSSSIEQEFERKFSRLIAIQKKEQSTPSGQVRDRKEEVKKNDETTSGEILEKNLFYVLNDSETGHRKSLKRINSRINTEHSMWLKINK